MKHNSSDYDISVVIKEVSDTAKEAIESIRDARHQLDALDIEFELTPGEIHRDLPDFRLSSEDQTSFAAIAEEIRRMGKQMEDIEARLRTLFNQEKLENSEKE